MSAPRLAVQVYTLRHECARDLLGTLEGIAAAGYRAVEWFGGTFGVAEERLAGALADLGLAVVAAHVALEELERDPEAAAARAAALGCSTLVCPWVSEERRCSYADLGRLLDGLGARFAQRGVALAYHHHDFELRAEEDGRDGLRQLLAHAAPENLAVELDVYWLAFAGCDPAATLHELGERVRLVHLKDGRLDQIGFTPLGAGEVNLAAVLFAARAVGVAALVVEQDECDGSPFAAITQSLDYLRRVGGAELA